MDTTTLNVEYLTKLNVSEDEINFIVRNKLDNYPISRLNEIKGDLDIYCDGDGLFSHLAKVLSLPREYDTEGNLLYHMDTDGTEYWSEYNSDGNEVLWKTSYGAIRMTTYGDGTKHTKIASPNPVNPNEIDITEYWDEYRQDGKLVYHKSSIANFPTWEYWIKYDSNGNEVHRIDSRNSESLKEYDAKNNLIYHKREDGNEYWYEYDSNGNETKIRNSDGYEGIKEFGNGSLPTLVREFRNGKMVGEQIAEYDSNGNPTYYRNTDGWGYWSEYESNGNEIYRKMIDGKEYHYPVEYYPSGQLKRYRDLYIPDINEP